MEKFAGLELACAGVGMGAYLIKKGLWYQGSQKGRVTRAASIALGLFMFIASTIAGLIAIAP